MQNEMSDITAGELSEGLYIICTGRDSSTEVIVAEREDQLFLGFYGQNTP